MEQKSTKESKHFQELKHHGRRLSIKEGIFSTVKGSFGDQYIIPFAIAINSSNALVMIMSAIGSLVGPLSQIVGSKLIESHPRKKIVTRAVTIESLLWLGFIGIGILYLLQNDLRILPLLLITLFGIYSIMLNLSGPAWFSWMGDLVDESFRGRWFSKRNLIVGLFSLTLSIGSAVLLEYLKIKGVAIYGFIGLFTVAMCARLYAVRIFKKQFEPHLAFKKSNHFTFLEFIFKAPKTNFGKFVLFRGFLSFSMGLTGALVAIYLLRYLQFDYITYMVITSLGTFLSILILKLWGKIADTYGNYKTMIITGFVVPFYPLLLTLSPSPIYLILGPMFIGSAVWAGFTLAEGNFIYDNVSKEKRGLAVSYYNIVLGIGAFLGAITGGILLEYLKIPNFETIYILFIAGFVLRAITLIVGLPLLKEVQPKHKFNGKAALANIVIRGAKPMILEELQEVREIKRYITQK